MLRRYLLTFAATFSLALSGVHFSGCQTEREAIALEVPPYQPANVHGMGSPMPTTLRRVVVLPIWHAQDDWPFLAEMDHTLAEELAKTGRFEVVRMSAAEMRTVFGSDRVASTDLLPANLMQVLRQRYAADAALLTDLTIYDPYRPITVGLRMKLLNLKTGELPWALDTVYNSGNAAVVSGARRYQIARQNQPFPLNRGLSILQSPSQFSRYAIWQSLCTLPPHPQSAAPAAQSAE